MITVVDRGFSRDENLRYLSRAGAHWIAGERMRDGSPDVAEALARQGRYQTVRDNLRVKEVRVGTGDAAKRFIICHNPVEAEREQTTREDTIRRLEAELERIERQRAKAKSAKHLDAHTRAECALRDHPALGRYLRQTGGPAADRPRPDRGRGQARRQVHALQLRPRPLSPGRRARLQEPARGRTRLPRSAATGIQPPPPITALQPA